MVGTEAAVPTRRERMRAATVAEIQQAARRLLAEQGHAGLTTRAIARVMGMTSPALYRYYASHEELVDALLAELFDELSEHLRQAAEQARDSDPLVALVAASRALRDWAVLRVREYEFMLVYPMSSSSMSALQMAARRRFGGVMLGLAAAVVRPGSVPSANLDAAATAAMVEYCAQCGVELAPAVAPAAVQCWVRLHGSVSMITMGQLDPLGEHVDALFEAELRAMAALLGRPGAELPPA